jgi:hypothetical protein
MSRIKKQNFNIYNSMYLEMSEVKSSQVTAAEEASLPSYGVHCSEGDEITNET